MYNHNAGAPPNPPPKQCPHCGAMDDASAWHGWRRLVGVAVTMPWGFYECENKAACRARREAELAKPVPRRCVRCHATDWLVGGGPRGPRHIHCLDADRCRARRAERQAALPPSERPRPSKSNPNRKPKRRHRPNPTIAPRASERRNP